ncbi:RsmB/NOP family class I SAM-dependent RNA methyltransferase, partial [Sphingobacterium shayense]|nr:RsmB/NOP family class I SAM-dependent RNA methyltransferase [Sphingobacterium shayense]
MADINPRRVEQQIRNFQKAITAYNYNEPFARFISQFFKNNRQMGSSDRRMTSRLCYNYFRLGKGFRKLEPLERLTVAEFLCEQYSDLVALYQPTWTVSQTLSIVEKVSFLATIYGSKLIDEVIPFSNELSTGIDRDTFLISHFVQPDLFIRVK